MAFKTKSSVTGSSNVARARNRVLGLIVALTIIVIVCILTAIATAETKKTITVVRVKQDAAISANAMITEDMIEPYEMYYKEYAQYGTTTFSDGIDRGLIITWGDRDLVVGVRYAAYYLREGTVMFWDSTLKDQTRKNSYLYSMDGELLNIQMNTVQDFGDMVVPGDTLNIRASYEKVNYDLPSEEAYMLDIKNGLNAASEPVTTTVIEPLFEEVQVLDMLNSAGASIFDIFYEYTAMSKAEQAMALKDDEFLNSVQPQSILLEVTTEEAEHYMRMQANSAEYQITLLPRTGSSAIIDSLADIQEALRGINKDGDE